MPKYPVQDIQILVVDDSMTQAEKLKFILEEEGFRILTALNGLDALDILKKKACSLVISDIMMPGMDGYQLCREIKSSKKFENIPVILLTSLSEPADIVKGLESGADNFIMKPYENQYLISRVRHILSNMEIKKVENMQIGVEVAFAGQKHYINADRLQILNLLLSTYDFAVQRNNELLKTQNELKELNMSLEKKVDERTGSLSKEIEERKLMEAELEKSRDFYLTLFEEFPTMIWRSGTDGKCNYLNNAWADFTGGAVQDKDRFRENIIHPDDVEKYVTAFKNTFKDRLLFNMEYRLRRRSGEYRWIVDIGRPFNDLHGDFAGYIGSCSDITECKKAEGILRQSYEKSKKTITDIVGVIAKIAEMRDAYTAGHQRRVAELATAIAVEIGLDKEKTEGIRMAGIIHDIGKICVPAEILSKPSRLTDIEMMLIKTHPQEGYNIIKFIEFPWPIASIILQHHERLDGSGYPMNLKSENITVEARILCVADVVEAMASHRPYRPALGIDAAMDEIQRKSGILYDQNVVNACLRLIKEKKFEFDELK